MKTAKGNATQKSEVTTIVTTLKEILSVEDPAAPATRRHLKDTAKKLSLALETPGETVQRVAYYVGPR